MSVINDGAFNINDAVTLGYVIHNSDIELNEKL